MTDIDIAELVKKYRYDSDGLLAALEAMLPKPTCPEHMLGLWAQHPEHGRVLVTYDRPDEDGDVIVAVRMAEHRGGVAKKAVTVSELTFPHQVTKGELPTETEYNTLSWWDNGLTIRDKEDGQEVGIYDKEIAQLAYAMLAYAGDQQPNPATRPEDVPVGEAWLVNVDDGTRRAERVVALKVDHGTWRTGEDAVQIVDFWWNNHEVTLITPLTPGPTTTEPEFVETEEEYEALPEGSIVGDYLAPSKRKTETLWQKMPSGHWWRVGMDYSANLAGERRRVLRRGWGNG